MRQVICNPERGTEILQRGLSGRSQTSQNGTEEQPLQNRPANHGDTASGVSHLSKAAILMGCSRQYVYKLVALGKLKASRISNRMAFIRKADIERMLEGNPYHRILPGSTSAQKKFTPSSPLAKKKKGKGNRRSDGLLFGRGGNVALQGQAVVAIHHRQAQPHTYLPHRREELLQQKHIDEFSVWQLIPAISPTGS